MTEAVEASVVELTHGESHVKVFGYAGEYVFEQVRRSGAFYERDLLETVASIPLGAGLVVDIGANLGNHTLYFAGVERRRVLAVEPEPGNVALLELASEANGLADLVQVVPAALGEAAGVGHLVQNIEGNRGTFALRPGEGAVRVSTLDEVVGSQAVAFIKIDVEGAELGVLRGGLTTIGRDLPVISVECHAGAELGRIASILEPLGYVVGAIAGNSDNYIWLHGHAHAPALARLQARALRGSTREVLGRLNVLGRDVQRVGQHAVDAVSAAGRGAVVDALAGSAAATAAALRSSSPHVKVASAFGGQLGVREVGPGTRRDTIRVGIATMPGREKGVAEVVRRLYGQVDEIFVYLNGYAEPPADMPTGGKVRVFTGPDLGDRAKFLFLRDFHGYYLVCDDDIAYPSFYVASIVDGIERYGRRAVVGWHGSKILPEFEDYYDKASRKVYTFNSQRPVDVGVHILGTGICGFHTDTISIEYEQFLLPSMSDVWFALAAQRQRVPLVTLAHDGRLCPPLNPYAPSISRDSIRLREANGLNVRQQVTEIVKAWSDWRIHPAGPAQVRETFSMAIIGRTDVTKWKKGGILRSTHLTADVLRGFGVPVHLEDIVTGSPKDLGGFAADLVMVYVGDPERADFAQVEEIVRHHAALGRGVVVNLTLEGTHARSAQVAAWLEEWDAAFPGRVVALTFAHSARMMAGLERVQDHLIELPKTIAIPPPPTATFEGSHGVFVGDVAKLVQPHLLGGGPAREWIDAIREALPGVPLFGVRQYTPLTEPDFELDETWPFLKHDLSERLTSARLMVAPVKHLSFEMLPVEAMGLGLPVVYRDMPQSLSEYIGLAGVRIERPRDLLDVLPPLYHDKAVWTGFSQAGALRAQSQEVRHASAQMYLQLRALWSRTRR